MKTVGKQRHKKDGRITPRTRDDFLYWLRKNRIAKEEVLHAQALSNWADDGGQSMPRQSHLEELGETSEELSSPTNLT